MSWSLGWQTDLMMRRLSGAIIREGRGYVTVCTPTNPDHRRGNFLLLDHRPDRASLAGWVAVFQREIGTEHVVIGVDPIDSSMLSGNVFHSAGFRGERSAVLAVDRSRIPEPNSSSGQGFDIRRLDGDADWAAALQLRRGVHQNAAEVFSRRRHDELSKLCADGFGAWFGAFLVDQMCSGLGVFSDGLGVGRFQHVETDPQYRRRGLARALLTRAANYAVAAMGVSTLVIVSDPEYFAADLYRSVGFVDVGSQQSGSDRRRSREVHCRPRLQTLPHDGSRSACRVRPDADLELLR